MTFAYFDRVQETSSTTGTGNIALGGAVTGYQTFSNVFNNHDTMHYCIADQNGSNWEVGIGTYNSGADSLSRTTVLASSNGGSLVNFTSGSLFVFNDAPALAINYIPQGGRTVTTSPVTMLNSDNIVNINVASTVSVTGASSRTPYKPYTIKDAGGNAYSNPITYTPASGTIDGMSSIEIQQNYDALTIYSDGTNEFTM